MFKKIEPLSKETHQDLRHSAINSYDFATTVLNAPLTATEFAPASRYYPIVFSIEEITPMAIFSLNQEKNRYINDDGSWKVPYVPAHIRRYPFILANTAKENAEDEKDNYVVCIDPEAPHFAAGQGDPLFTADGTPTDLTQNAANFLSKFHHELQTTLTVCQELEDQGVLVVKGLSREIDGQSTPIGKFRCVEMEKLNKLEDAVLAKWVRNGLMNLIYIHLQSLANLKALT